MTRKARQHGRVTLPTCPTCGIFHPPEDTAQRELCESFALFRSALTPEFGAFVGLLPAGLATPLMARFKPLSTIGALSGYLLQLQETKEVNCNLEATRRIYNLNQIVDRILRSSEFVDLDDLKHDTRYDFEKIVGRRQELMLREFEELRDIQILIEILHSRVSRWTAVVDHRRLIAATLLVQAAYFAFSHKPNEPEAVDSQVNLPMPLAQGA